VLTRDRGGFTHPVTMLVPEMHLAGEVAAEETQSGERDLSGSVDSPGHFAVTIDTR
jgi:hypothetical protein